MGKQKNKKATPSKDPTRQDLLDQKLDLEDQMMKSAQGSKEWNRLRKKLNEILILMEKYAMEG